MSEQLTRAQHAGRSAARDSAERSAVVDAVEHVDDAKRARVARVHALPIDRRRAGLRHG